MKRRSGKYIEHPAEIGLSAIVKEQGLSLERFFKMAEHHDYADAKGGYIPHLDLEHMEDCQEPAYWDVPEDMEEKEQGPGEEKESKGLFSQSDTSSMVVETSECGCCLPN